MSIKFTSVTTLFDFVLFSKLRPEPCLLKIYVSSIKFQSFNIAILYTKLETIYIKIQYDEESGLTYFDGFYFSSLNRNPCKVRAIKLFEIRWDLVVFKIYHFEQCEVCLIFLLRYLFNALSISNLKRSYYFF